MGAHLILGTGLAGLSLACALPDAEVHEQIVLVDGRTSFEHDRTFTSSLPDEAAVIAAVARPGFVRAMTAGDARRRVPAKARFVHA